MTSSREQGKTADSLIGALIARLTGDQVIRHVDFSGRSMLPWRRERLSTKKAPERLKKYDLPMYRGPGGKYVMHRIVDVKDDHYVCLGDNTYVYEKVRREQIVAMVCAFYRGDRRISVEAPGYRLYCRFWCAAYPVRKLLRRAKHWLGRRLK